jgi:DNA-binding SARP family transcriptional activator
MTDRSASPFAAILQARRVQAGLTQKSLADIAGLSLGAIHDLEQGRRRLPRQTSIRQLAFALGLDDIEFGELACAAERPRPCGLGAWQSPARPPSVAAGEIWLQVLGPVAAWRNDHKIELGPPKQRTVLAFLATRPGSLVHRETIIDTLWDDPPPSAVNLVQGYVSRLRGMLEPARSTRDRGGRLMTIGTGYQLNVTAAELDLLCFRQLAEMARLAWEQTVPALASELFAEALGMWRDTPLADIDRCRSRPVVAGLNREHANAVLSYADCCDQLGQPSHALPYLWSLTASDPFYEPAYARLITALAKSGDQASAVRVFESLRQRLDSELGVYPGTEVANAYTQLLRQVSPYR